MRTEFDLDFWNRNSDKLMKLYPQLTHADLMWRHESKRDLFMTIADTLGIQYKELEEIVDRF